MVLEPFLCRGEFESITHQTQQRVAAVLMLRFVLLLDGSSGGVSVPLWVKRGSLRFPEEKDTPVIMVGPGTGVAPFRSAVQERVAQGRHGKSFYCLARLGSARLGCSQPS